MTALRTLTAACLGAALLAVSPFSSAVEAPHSALFSGALGAYGGGLDYDFNYDDSLADLEGGVAGGTPYFHSKAQSDYGINRAYSQVIGGDLVDGPFTGSVSGWADALTVTGGVGQFDADVSVTLSGQFSTASYSEAFYGLFALTPEAYSQVLGAGDDFIYDLIVGGPPESLAYEPIILLGSNSAEDDGTPGSFTATGTIHGTYDQPLYLVSVLVTYAEQNGEVNVFDTAVFGLTGPLGSSVSTGSGVTYAAAVPEPGTYALFAIGAALMFAAQRRARRRS